MPSLSEKKFGNFNFDWKMIYGIPRVSLPTIQKFIPRLFPGKTPPNNYDV